MDIETTPAIQVSSEPVNVGEHEDVKLILSQIEDAVFEVESSISLIDSSLDELRDLEDLPEEVAADVRMHAEDFRGEVSGLANDLDDGICRLRKQLTALELGPEKTEASDDDDENDETDGLPLSVRQVVATPNQGDTAIPAGAVTTDFSKIPVAAIGAVVSAFKDTDDFEELERLQRSVAAIEEWLDTLPPKIRYPHLDHGSEPA